MDKRKKIVKAGKPEIKEFPCEKLKYCPYGWLVEIFPIDGKKTTHWDGAEIGWLAVEPIKGTYACPVYSHDCPVFYTAEIPPEPPEK